MRGLPKAAARPHARFLLASIEPTWRRACAGLLLGELRSLKAVPKIPHAALTVEDAVMLLRMQRRGSTLRIRLAMDAHNFADVQLRRDHGVRCLPWPLHSLSLSLSLSLCPCQLVQELNDSV